MQTQWFEPGWDPADEDEDEGSAKDWGDWFEFESFLETMGRDERASRDRHPSSR